MSVYYKEKKEHFIQSIESMLNQTLPPNEFIIVKDGKLTRELDEVVKEFESKNPGLFKIVQLEKNIGLGKALDIGLDFCSNELVARMDADDISLPERCEKQVEAFAADPMLSIIGTFIDEFYDNPQNIVSSRIVPTNDYEIKKFMKRRSPFNHPTVMYRKSDVLRCGGYGKMRKKQDLDLFSRMINNGCKSKNIDESLLLFRSDENNFKRRKSFSYCKSYIEVQFEIWKRGHCSFSDLAFVTLGQVSMFLMPIPFLKIVSNKLLRKKVDERVA